MVIIASAAIVFGLLLAAYDVGYLRVFISFLCVAIICMAAIRGNAILGSAGRQRRSARSLWIAFALSVLALPAALHFLPVLELSRAALLEEILKTALGHGIEKNPPQAGPPRKGPKTPPGFTISRAYHKSMIVFLEDRFEITDEYRVYFGDGEFNLSSLDRQATQDVVAAELIELGAGVGAAGIKVTQQYDAPAIVERLGLARSVAVALIPDRDIFFRDGKRRISLASAGKMELESRQFRFAKNSFINADPEMRLRRFSTYDQAIPESKLPISIVEVELLDWPRLDMVRTILRDYSFLDLLLKVSAYILGPIFAFALGVHQQLFGEAIAGFFARKKKPSAAGFQSAKSR